MTYGELVELLVNMPYEIQDMSVTVYIPWEDEYFPIYGNIDVTGKENDVLGEGHPFLTIL